MRARLLSLPGKRELGDPNFGLREKRPGIADTLRRRAVGAWTSGSLSKVGRRL